MTDNELQTLLTAANPLPPSAPRTSGWTRRRTTSSQSCWPAPSTGGPRAAERECAGAGASRASCCR